jgi:[protein-PII] uridylyltransferase
VNQPVTHESSFREERAALLDEGGLRGDGLARALSDQADGWLRTAAAGLPDGWALLATGGYADGTLCPGSDLDVLLLHPRRARADHVNAVARDLWYPFWDSGLKISPAVHTVDGVLRLASEDLVTATTLLRTRVLGGSVDAAEELASKARAHWRKHAKRWMRELVGSVRDRHAKSGEVAFLLGPNLKEGRGGLRDIQAVDWALVSAVSDMTEWLVRPLDALLAMATPLLAARVELHRGTKRTGDQLVLEEQDAVAARLGYGDADALMATLAETARTVSWVSDRFWERVESDFLGARFRQGRAVAVGPGLVLEDDRLRVSDDDVDGSGAGIVRLAASAARLGVLPHPDSLRRLESEAGPVPTPWPREVLDDFVSLLDSGPALIQVVEALDQHRLFATVIPQWQSVRSRPQRNAYHTYTVDRHLLETVVNAGRLVRRVRRPDLLLLAAFLHDIGKDGSDDHVIAGAGITKEIGVMMGLSPVDIDTLVRLVDHHLLLAETATRRDVSDPGTAEVVAEAVGDVETLHLLQALTEADSLATGPSAWSSWKAGLIDELCQATQRRLEGQLGRPAGNCVLDAYADALRRARETTGVHLEADDHSCIVATSDRRGLFAVIAGVMAAHGIEILGANAWTTEDGIALDEFRVTRRIGGQPDWKRVEGDLESALAGTFDIEAKIERRARSYLVHRQVMAATAAKTPRAEVLVDNETSANATIIEVRAPDAPALLFRLANVIASHLLDIRHAKVATLGHEVVDVFYVQDRSSTEARKLSVTQCESLADAMNGVVGIAESTGHT